MRPSFTKCGCKIEPGAWLYATCDHGSDWIFNIEGELELALEMKRPRIVCLCGSTRFFKQFQQANFEETMKGNIVLSVGFYPHSTEQAHGQEIGITSKQKEDLDILHFRKIDLADEVFILNVNNYIGESTARELAYAKSMGKKIRFLEGDKDQNRSCPSDRLNLRSTGPAYGDNWPAT